MKTLVNKRNPAIKIIADTLLSDSFNYITSFCSVPKSDWTLVEEEPAEGIKGNLEEIPSNVDLEKEIYKYYAEWDGSPRYVQTARHFYKLGLNARKV